MAFWFLLLIILITYGRSLPIYFSGDDWVFLYGATRGWDLPYLFSFSPGSFAPFINITFLLAYKLFYLNLLYYHLLLLLIHTLNTLLLGAITRQITRDNKLAFMTAALFAVFSPYNQIVIWVSGLAGLLTSLFFLSSLYLFIKYRLEGKAFYALGALSSFILAFLCKEWAISLFPLFIVCDLLFFKTQRKIKIYLPFIIILLIYLLAELSLPYGGKSEMFGPHIFSNLSTYLNRLIIPSLNVSEFPLKNLHPLLKAGLPLLLKTLSILWPILSLIALWRGPKIVKFQLLWIYITLSPFLFFKWGTASRYYYLASMGFIALLSYLFLNLYETSRNKTGKTLLALGLSLFIIVHIFFIEIRITKLYSQNRQIQSILDQLQRLHPHFPANSHLFFSGFSYDRKWSYAIRTIYADPSLIVYRHLPAAHELNEISAPVFVFNYTEGILRERPWRNKSRS